MEEPQVDGSALMKPSMVHSSDPVTDPRAKAVMAWLSASLVDVRHCSENKTFWPLITRHSTTGVVAPGNAHALVISSRIVVCCGQSSTAMYSVDWTSKQRSLPSIGVVVTVDVREVVAVEVMVVVGVVLAALPKPYVSPVKINPLADTVTPLLDTKLAIDPTTL